MSDPDLLEFRRAAEREVVRCAYDLGLAKLGCWVFGGRLESGPDGSLVDTRTRELMEAVDFLVRGVLADARMVSTDGMDSLIARARAHRDAEKARDEESDGS